MGVTKSCSQPITNRGVGGVVSTVSSVSCLQHANIDTDTWNSRANPQEVFSYLSGGVSIEARRDISLTKRLDKTLPKLDQWLASMSQAVPPQPTGRTETGIRRIPDIRNSNAGHLCRRTGFGCLFSAQVDGRAVGCLLISETARWFDRPTLSNSPYNKQTSWRSNHWWSIFSIDRSANKQTNHSTGLL